MGKKGIFLKLEFLKSNENFLQKRYVSNDNVDIE